MFEMYRSKPKGKIVVKAFQVGSGPIPDWLLSRLSESDSYIVDRGDICTGIYLYRQHEFPIEAVNGGWVYMDKFTGKLQILSDLEFTGQFDPVGEDEIKGKTRISTKLKLFSLDNSRFSFGDASNMALEAANEIDRLVNDLEDERRRAKEAEAKSNPPKFSLQEVMEWANKKMQEEKYNG